jgi:hypothetical protein
MKKNTLKILFLIYSNLIFAQTKIEDLNLTKDSDTIYWNKYKKGLIKKFNLEDIESKKDEIIFKFWTYGTCIEVTKNDTIINGSLTYFVEEISEFSNNIFKKTFSLKSDVSKNIFTLIKKSEINEIASDKFIEGWQHGFDGIEYLIEYKTKNDYSFKNYWTPNSQFDIEEAKIIQNFVNELYEICDSESLSKEFVKEIPFRSYSYNGGSSVVVRAMTMKEYRKYKKEKRKRKKENK